MAKAPVRAEGRTHVQHGNAQQADAGQADAGQADAGQADAGQVDAQQAGIQAAGPARGADRDRPLRADARRNRERVLETAFDAFATEGLSVSVHEIARRAGVGTGTVSRHFPTKEALFEAVFVSRVERLVAMTRQLSEAEDAGTALFSFFAAIVAEGAANRGLADALTGAGFDIKTAASGPEHDVMGALSSLLARAQQAGSVRHDIDTADVIALVTGCLARESDPQVPAARDRLISVVREGLRPSR
jgi:AcrR family transcriptional regulator